MASKVRADSVYRNTPVVSNKYLDILVPPVNNVTDYNTYSMVIESKYDNRPDLLAYELYGNAKLWWVFAAFNQDTLVDPIIDFKSGTTINVPTKFV
jgi:hypothetical protein